MYTSNECHENDLKFDLYAHLQCMPQPMEIIMLGFHFVGQTISAD